MPIYISSEEMCLVSNCHECLGCLYFKCYFLSDGSYIVECSELSKVLECTVLSMVGYTVHYKEPLKSFNKNRA